MPTALLMSRDGPHSPLIFLYFLVIAAAPLRLSLPLVYAATLGAMGAATLMMGHYVFVGVGRENYYDLHNANRGARTADVIFLLSLGVAGVLCWRRGSARAVWGREDAPCR